MTETTETTGTDRSSWPTADELAEMSMHDQEMWERLCAEVEAAKAVGEKETDGS